MKSCPWKRLHSTCTPGYSNEGSKADLVCCQLAGALLAIKVTVIMVQEYLAICYLEHRTVWFYMLCHVLVGTIEMKQIIWLTWCQQIELDNHCTVSTLLVQ